MVHSLKDVVLLNSNIFKVLFSRGSSKTKVLQYYNLYLINIKLEILFHEAVFFFSLSRGVGVSTHYIVLYVTIVFFALFFLFS
jgi:hypothetical protein